jgi:hypothetical protein
MISFPETMYYAELEGLLPTRIGKINAAIKDIREYPSSEIPFSIFVDILNRHGLVYSDLSQRELNYIDTYIK